MDVEQRINSLETLESEDPRLGRRTRKVPEAVDPKHVVCQKSWGEGRDNTRL